MILISQTVTASQATGGNVKVDISENLKVDIRGSHVTMC
jgi:hypothetical protein